MSTNSKPCLSDSDQKHLDIAVTTIKGDISKDEKEIMALTVLQEVLGEEIEYAKKRYYDAEKQIDDQVKEYINSDQAKKYINDQVEKYINDQVEKQIYDEVEKKFKDDAKKKFKDGAVLLLDFYKKRVDSLIVRSNTFGSIISNIFKRK